LAARPRRLCAPCEVCPEPPPVATSRPHAHRAAAAQGSLSAHDRRTMCMLVLSPAHVRRAGRMPACLCAQHPQRAWPRQGQCVRTRRAPSARASRMAASLSSRRARSSAASRCSAAASASARASRRALGAPGQRVPLSQHSMALHGETSLRPAELHHRMPHAATCRACAAVPLTVCHILALQNQARALQQLLRVHSRLRARLASSARSCASAAEKRCSAAFTSSCASVRASST